MYHFISIHIKLKFPGCHAYVFFYFDTASKTKKKRFSVETPHISRSSSNFINVNIFLLQGDLLIYFFFQFYQFISSVQYSFIIRSQSEFSLQVYYLQKVRLDRLYFILFYENPIDALSQKRSIYFFSDNVKSYSVSFEYNLCILHH